jgi:hypothetical protein
MCGTYERIILLIKLRVRDMSRPDDFIDISGSKMRALAKAGAVPCDVSGGKTIPSKYLCIAAF